MKAIQIIGANVRRLRVAKGISQEALAVDSGVDVSYMSGIETGRVNPTIKIIDRIATALSVDFFELAKKPKVGQAAPRPLKSGRRKK
jgi:transcriptional regulator with XRE-family HTH domain